ncbi:MAG: PAS domain-containing protein, partial [Chloroflexota bacterium]
MSTPADKQSNQYNNITCREVMDEIPLLVCRYTPDFDLTFVNKAYCEWLGKSPEELYGVNILNMIPEAQRDGAVATVRALTPENPRSVNKHQAILEDGTTRWIEWTDTLLLDDDNQTIGYQAIGRDVTEQKQAEETLAQSEALFRSLIENSNDIITVIDADGVIRYESPSIETILGYTPDDMIGQKAIRFVNNISLAPDQQTFLSEEDVERFDFNALFANVGDFGPIKIGSRHQDGSMRTLDIRGINLLDDDNFQGIIIFASDI